MGGIRGMWSALKDYICMIWLRHEKSNITWYLGTGMVGTTLSSSFSSFS